MMLVLMPVLLVSGLQQENQEHQQRPSSTLMVTISPEARISVERRGALPRPASCDKPIPVGLDVRNESGAPLPLVVSSPQKEATIGTQQPLNGRRQEVRTLMIALHRPGLIDISLQFSVGPATGDLAWRSGTHLLLRCIEP